MYMHCTHGTHLSKYYVHQCTKCTLYTNVLQCIMYTVVHCSSMYYNVKCRVYQVYQCITIHSVQCITLFTYIYIICIVMNQLIIHLHTTTVCAEKHGTLAEFNRRSLKLNNSSMEEEIYIILFFPDQLIVYITGFKPNFYFLTFLHWTTVNQSCRTIF